jgi:hypothetical protein
MTPRITAVCAGALLTAAALGLSPAHALSMQECSAKYKAAQQNNTLNGMKWNDFRKAECGSDAAAAAAPASTRATTASANPSASATTKAGNAVYPTSVSAKYSKESEGKARMHTCLDQYNANKATNGNGGMTWIQKGGGYYSECNKRLKG